MTTHEKAQIAAELFADEETGMVWQPVESSQIAEIGYDASTATLGIRFKAGKRSAASEYHYANVPVGTHHALMTAESVGTYFGQNIKSRPSLYPFTKIEADPLPGIKGAIASFMEDHGVKEVRAGSTVIRTNSSDGATKTTPTQSPASETIDTPSTALAVIDTMADDLLFTPGAITDAQLAAGRDWYLTEAKKYDISTEKARAEFKRFARPLQKLRTGIEARAKELTGATKRKIAAIDAEKRRLVQIVGGIEDEVLEPLTSWEAEEEARKVRLAKTVNYLADRGAAGSLLSIAEIESVIAELESFDLSTMQEYKIGAESAIAASLKVLKPELERRRVSEAQALELEQLRAEKAERDRKDEIAREAEKLVAQKIAEATKPAEAQPYIPAPSEEIGVPLPGLHSAPAIEAQREHTAIGAADGSQSHEQAVNGEAVAELMNHCYLDRQESIRVVAAIAKGLIPHVRIEY